MLQCTEDDICTRGPGKQCASLDTDLVESFSPKFARDLRSARLLSLSSVAREHA
jgi:hypothetical protein